MNNIEEVIEKFQEQGYKITPQRREIFEIVVHNKSHPKAEDIYHALKERMPDVSLATVYNTLKTLKDLGLIQVIGAIGDDSVHYDPTTRPHDHFYCLCCNRILDVEESKDYPGYSERIIPGFKIVRQQVTYYGYCPECLATLRSREGDGFIQP